MELFPHLVPWVSLNLRELKFSVIWVHALNFFSSWSSQNFDDFNQLVNSTLSREKGLGQYKYGGLGGVKKGEIEGKWGKFEGKNWSTKWSI